jgi:hypothetical protein
MMPRKSHRIHSEFLNRSSRYFVSITKLLLISVLTLIILIPNWANVGVHTRHKIADCNRLQR